MFKVKLFITILIGWCCMLGMANGRVLICDYNPSSIKLRGDNKFEPSDIDPTLCTHLIYPMQFKMTSSGGYKIVKRKYDFDNRKQKGSIPRIMKLKNTNSNFKVFASVGKKGMGLKSYLEMAVNATKRELFIETALSFLQDNGFDGLDLNWRFRHNKGDSPQSRLNFVKILEELKEAFKEPKLELSITVGSGYNMNRISYHIPSVVNHVDFVNVLADKFWGKQKNVNYRIPLRGENKRTVMSLVKHWNNQGAPSSKLVLGLSFFSTYVKLSDSQQFEMANPVNDYKTELKYSNICRKEKKWNIRWDSIYDVSFVQHHNRTFSYDNVKSLELRVDFGNCFQLAGYHVSTIDYDDFRGKCGVKYPLLRAINNKLNESPVKNYCFKNGFNYTDGGCV